MPIDSKRFRSAPGICRLGRRLIISKLALVILLGMDGSGALASPGCDAVNAKAFDGETTDRFRKTISGFTIGDKISIRTTCAYCWSRDLAVANLISGDESTVSAGLNLSYEVTGNNQDTTLTFAVSVLKGGNLVLHTFWRGTCTPAGAAPK